MLTGKPMKHNSLEQDTPRTDYIQGYIGAVLNAIRNGSDTRGYFVWSMFDLFEILSGYKYTYGLNSVNFSVPELKRSPKLSAKWYSEFLKGTANVASKDIIKLQSNFSDSSSL